MLVINDMFKIHPFSPFHSLFDSGATFNSDYESFIEMGLEANNKRSQDNFLCHHDERYSWQLNPVTRCNFKIKEGGYVIKRLHQTGPES